MKTTTFVIISRTISIKMRNISDKRGNQTRILNLITFFFFPGNRAVYEIIWKDIIERSRPQAI
jgi:hypothetical protein